MSDAEIVPLGENALIVRLSTSLDPAANDRARGIADTVASSHLAGVTDIVPANSSVGIYFAADADAAAIRTEVSSIVKNTRTELRTRAAHHEIPVRYDGPDIEEIATRTGFSVSEIAEIHSGREYQVFAIGFAPGFGYLGELDERIAMPRRPEPRTKVPAGSVAIANRQTAIYPFTTPGGWNIIGTTSLRVFDRDRDPASLFEVGDRVRFIPHD